MNSDIVLEINNLYFGYNKNKFLFKDFNLKLKKGEIISVVGKSGVGKTTLFSLIRGELKPIKGYIKCLRLSQIFQDPYSSFHPSYTILSQIKDVCNIEDIEMYIDELSLQRDLLNKLPYELSGGQLQRCSILRVLLMKSDIILADEPTSALDNIVQLDTMKLLIKYLKYVGILIITHDEYLAKWCSNQIIKIGE